jgi:hypothetical protein
MPKKAKAPKAIVIDDAYALPTARTFTKYEMPLRKFLRNTPEAKLWFDKQFGLTEAISKRAYFEPILQSQEKLSAFWEARNDCPIPGYLDAIGDLVAEVNPKKAPLKAIEDELVKQGYFVTRHGRLPDVAAVDPDVSLVVIDYVLMEDIPDNVDTKVAESIKFLKELIRSLAKTGRCPLVILVSSLPTLTRDRAQSESFKAQAEIQGGFFRFVSKAKIAQLLGGYVEGFARERDELNAFRNFHERFAEALDKGAALLMQQIRALELHDLATLQVGQLAFEGESLGDYLSWICGQVLTNKLLSDPPVAHHSDLLPTTSYKVLLGNLAPSRGIPNLFNEVSSVRTASSELAMQRRKKRDLRFGDVFARVAPSTPARRATWSSANSRMAKCFASKALPKSSHRTRCRCWKPH